MSVFVKAGPFWTKALKTLGGPAITMPWGKAYFLPSHVDNRQTRKHELQHLKQIRHDGP